MKKSKLIMVIMLLVLLSTIIGGTKVLKQKVDKKNYQAELEEQKQNYQLQLKEINSEFEKLEQYFFENKEKILFVNDLMHDKEISSEIKKGEDPVVLFEGISEEKKIEVKQLLEENISKIYKGGNGVYFQINRVSSKCNFYFINTKDKEAELVSRFGTNHVKKLDKDWYVVAGIAE